MMRTSESNVSLMQKTVQTEIIFSLYLGTLTSMLYEENFKDKICSYNEIYTDHTKYQRDASRWYFVWSIHDARSEKH